MSFFHKDDDLLKKNNEIWEKVGISTKTKIFIKNLYAIKNF